MLPRTGFVYRDHGVLWLTAGRLFRSDGVAVPDDVRALIERVYGDAAGDAVPPGLERIHQDAQGTEAAGRAFARANLLVPAAGYVRDGQPWPDESRISTRLSGERRTLRLARWDGVRLAPICPDPDPGRAWAMSEVAVAARRIAG